MRFGEGLIELGEVKAGCDILQQLVQKRPFEYNLRFVLAANLLHYEKGKGLSDLFGGDFDNPLHMPFQYYNCLLAIFYYRTGYEKMSQEHLSIAKDMYPKSQDVLWLVFNLSMKKQDYKTAYEAIIEIHEVEPNDIPALLAKMELDYAKKDWKDLLETEQLISRSKRYIDKEIQEKGRALKEKALEGRRRRP
jgi:tetratricopeptide (TPR) repeat protein